MTGEQPGRKKTDPVTRVGFFQCRVAARPEPRATTGNYMAEAAFAALAAFLALCLALCLATAAEAASGEAVAVCAAGAGAWAKAAAVARDRTAARIFFMVKPLKVDLRGVRRINEPRARTVYVHPSFSCTRMKKTLERSTGNGASRILG